MNRRVGGGAASRDEARARGEELVRSAIANGIPDEQREHERRRHLSETPRWYRPEAHVAATIGIGAATIGATIAALSVLPPIRPPCWLVVPIVWVLANYAEWRLHKYVLHRRFRPLRVAYDLHTAMHHVIYVETDMAMRDLRELRMVMMPARFVLLLVLGTAPLAAAVGWAWCPQAGWLFIATAASSLVLYELLHLTYHLRPDGFVGRRAVIAALRAHHARHHDPRLMQHHNFNVTVPLFDWLMGTMAPARPAREASDATAGSTR